MNTATLSFEHRELDFEVTVKFSGGRKATYGNLSNHWGSPAEEPEMEVLEVTLVSGVSPDHQIITPEQQAKMEIESAEAFLYEGDGVWDDIYSQGMEQLSAYGDGDDR